ncbi:MAG: GNAT family N-acetyltransferase [Hyphomonadaceae bacterium]|nr:GNAT family N-acetyltransferase [Hyphomonadaceae bacterium]
MAEIRTERLILRPPAGADATRVGVLCRDPAVARMVTMMPFPQPDIAVEGFLLIMEARRRLGTDRVFALDLPGEGVIGVAGAHARGEEGVEIGYWLGRPFWGQGLATEAARAVTDVARALERGPVVAGHFTDNPASGRVLEKAGFVYTGEVTPRFSLARKEKADVRMMRHRAVN